MTGPSDRPTGLTKDVGYQIGVRRTLPLRLEDVWQLLTSAAGLRLWLGEGEAIHLSKGTPYQLANGTAGEVRVASPGSHLRLTWQPPGWPKASTIQLRVIPKGDRTVVAFHQEHLPGPGEREERREHYRSVLDKLEQMILSGTDPG